MNILTTAAKVSTHRSKHSNSQFNNELKKLSDKENKLKNNLKALRSKEGSNECQYERQQKPQKEKNIIMRQLRQKLKDEKATTTNKK